LRELAPEALAEAAGQGVRQNFAPQGSSMFTTGTARQQGSANNSGIGLGKGCIDGW